MNSTSTAEPIIEAPIIEARGLGKHYEIKRFLSASSFVKAVDGVSLRLMPKKTLAIVGESGCGKSTLARLLMRLEPASFGDLLFQGQSVAALSAREYRQSVQMIFQDPYSSLNPRKKAHDIIAEPLVINTDLSSSERDKRVQEVLAKVGLRPDAAHRYPHMFSGGQRQRIGIARALMLRPQVLICDEPVSALDISIQAQVLNLLMDLQDEFGLSYMFISHDLSVVRHIADEVMVMYLGRVMEYGTRQQIFENPQHPYTRMLLASTPDIASGLRRQEELGRSQSKAMDLPSPLNPPPGCVFQTRCSHVMEACRSKIPELRSLSDRAIACHRVDSHGRLEP